MKLCKDCKHCYVKPGVAMNLVDGHWNAVCSHPEALSLVNGIPVMLCNVAREDFSCGVAGIRWEPKE
jgi:hypothetical protein